MKVVHKVKIKDLLETAISAYLYQIHDFRNEEALRAVVHGIPEAPVVKCQQWWQTPEPLPASLEGLGPCPSLDFDPRGFKAWHKARKTILERLKAPMVEV